MNNLKSSYIYKIGGLHLKVLLKDNILKLDKRAGSYNFFTDCPKTVDSDFVISYNLVKKNRIPTTKPVFTGKSFDENQIPYEWYVFEYKDYFSVTIKINDSRLSGVAIADFHLQQKEISVYLEQEITEETLGIEPFFQPFGAILLNYITHFRGGILLHSSGVKVDKRGYVFSAVSGTGKSTMAGLWQQTGAQIINDDRLVLIPNDNKIIMTNTPMPYYQDVYKESEVSAIFLLKQSPKNYIKPLPGVAGITGLMSNCIQFLYNKEMVQKHLVTITNITKRCPVYEVGFKPTTEITDIIKDEFGGK
jgi:hypothetical protein